MSFNVIDVFYDNFLFLAVWGKFYKWSDNDFLTSFYDWFMPLILALDVLIWTFFGSNLGFITDTFEK